MMIPGNQTIRIGFIALVGSIVLLVSVWPFALKNWLFQSISIEGLKYDKLSNYSADTSNTLSQTKLYNHNRFDEECDRTGEWESIGNHSFFKRTAAYYFLDATMLNMYYMKLSSRQNNYTLQIVVLQHDQVIAKFNVSETSNRKIWETAEYIFGGLTAYLKGLSIDKNKISSYKMKVVVGDSVTGQKSDSYINVKIKNLYTQSIKKQGVLLITKCFYMTYKEYYLSLKWWIEINRRAGIDKILLCDQRIDKHPAFDDLYQKNQDLIEVTRLNCIPNLQANPKYSTYKYLKSYEQMESESRPDTNKMDILNMLLLNEGYLNNIDKYRYITHFDNDEIIMTSHASDFFRSSDLMAYINRISSISYVPDRNMSSSQNIVSALQSIQCSRYMPLHQPDNSYATKIPSNVFDTYLDEIKTKSKLKHLDIKSYYFTQSYYIPQQLADQIFDKLEHALADIDLDKILSNDTSLISIYLNVTDYNRPIESLTKGPHQFSITIKSHLELRYAINLLQIYKTYLRPYLDQNSALFLNHVQDFDRFFVLIGDVNTFFLGKTVHNTRSTLDMTIHFLQHFTYSNNSRIELSRGIAKRTFFIPNDLARLSHFRRTLNFQNKEFPIDSFIFDLNYFNCYFKPILNKFLKSN